MGRLLIEACKKCNGAVIKIIFYVADINWELFFHGTLWFASLKMYVFSLGNCSEHIISTHVPNSYYIYRYCGYLIIVLFISVR